MCRISRTTNHTLSYGKEQNFDKSIEIIGIKCNSNSSISVTSLINSTFKWFEKLYVLVDNTEVLLYKEIVDTPIEECIKVIQINLIGTFLFCKAVLPYME